MAIFNFGNGFSGVFSKKFVDWATSVASGYGRRMAEPYYDRIAETPFFQKLKQQEKPAKYLIEAMNNALTALIDQKIDDATPLRKLLKEIFMDSSSELNKRLLNGETSHRILAENADSLGSVAKNHLAVLLMLEEEKLDSLLKWILSLTNQERAEALKNLRDLNLEELERLSNLSPDARSRLFEALKEPSKEKLNDNVSDALKSTQEQLNQWLTAELKRKKERRARHEQQPETHS